VRGIERPGRGAHRTAGADQLAGEDCEVAVAAAAAHEAPLVQGFGTISGNARVHDSFESLIDADPDWMLSTT
jgi:hypothetical protein